MTTDRTDGTDEFDLAEAPAEGHGYYQAKTKQWIDLCPHLGPSDRTVLRILTDLTTHASNRRKVSLYELRTFVTTNPVALGEEPKLISESGLLRILRNLAALGQITADEDGTPLKFSSRKNAQTRPISMTIWRLPRHECGCHRNVFDALAAARGEEPRFEPARMDESAVRRRPKRAGQKSNPRRGAGQISNPGGQIPNSGGQKSNPHSQADQQEPDPPFTPSFTPSSSSAGAGVTPSPRVPADEDEETSSANIRSRKPRAVDLVCEMTDATQDEAAAVLERVKAEAARDGVRIRVLRRYVASFEAEDLAPHLAAIRAQRASEARTEANQSSGADTRCHTHHEVMPCQACRFAPKPVLVGLLKQYGSARRPDIARRLDELAGAR